MEADVEEENGGTPGAHVHAGKQKPRLFPVPFSLLSSGINPRWKNTSCEPSSSLESSAALSPSSFPLMDIAPAPSLLLSVTFIIWSFLECPSTFHRFNPVREARGNKERGDDTAVDDDIKRSHKEHFPVFWACLNSNI